MKACGSASVSKLEQESDLVLEDLEQDEELEQLETEVEEQSQRVSVCFTPGHAGSAATHAVAMATETAFLQTDEAETKTDQWTPRVKEKAEEAAASHSEQRLVSERDQNLEQEDLQTITGRQADQ